MKEQYKVVVMGSYGIGKTALVNRIISNRFLPTQSTIGSAFSVLKKGNAVIGLWDTAGNERYASLVPMYIRNADIVLLCVDASVIIDKGDIRKRIEHIHEHSNNGVHIIIVLTKCDDGEKVIEFGDEFGAVIMTSAKTGYGIEELIETITKTLGDESNVPNTITITPMIKGGEWWKLREWGFKGCL